MGGLIRLQELINQPRRDPGLYFSLMNPKSTITITLQGISGRELLEGTDGLILTSPEFAQKVLENCLVQIYERDQKAPLKLSEIANTSAGGNRLAHEREINFEVSFVG